jgi:hypothetical protein
MISNHTSLINELRPRVDLMASQVAAFLAGGGTIYQAPPSIYVDRPIVQIAPRDEAADLKYQSARHAAEEKQAFVDKIREMAKTMTQKDIVEATGVGRKVLFAMGQKHGFTFKFGRESKPTAVSPRCDRSQDDIRVERILAFKELGLSRTQAARQLSVNHKLFNQLLAEYRIEYPLGEFTAK